MYLTLSERFNGMPKFLVIGDVLFIQIQDGQESEGFAEKRSMKKVF